MLKRSSSTSPRIRAIRAAGMAALALLVLLATPCVSAQTQSAKVNAVAPLRVPVAKDIYANLAGRWTGLLEYKDLKTDAHVTLPTDLEVEMSADGKSLTMYYSFQQGPKKVVHDLTHVVIVPSTHTWRTTSEVDPEDVYRVEGMENLKDGRGKLVLLNSGVENGQNVEMRTTITIGNKLFVMEREVRPPGGEFTFRHAYTFTRAEGKAPTPPQEKHEAPKILHDDFILPSAPEPNLKQK